MSSCRLPCRERRCRPPQCISDDEIIGPALIHDNEPVCRTGGARVGTVSKPSCERKRLAKELHDGVGQNFLCVVGNLKSLVSKNYGTEISKPLQELFNVMTASLNELRRISRTTSLIGFRYLSCQGQKLESNFEKCLLPN